MRPDRGEKNVDSPICPRVRFGTFQLDALSGELSRDGRRVRLSRQAFQLLELLVRHPAEVVSRDELRERLWSSDTHVQFEVSLNTAVRKVREALGDSAAHPRFIETIPRRGYRFIAAVQPNETTPGSGPAVATRSPALRGLLAAGLILAVVLAGIGIVEARRWRQRPVSSDATEAYIRGVSAAGAQTYEGYRTAVAYFEEAVAKQPDHAEAYAALADAQWRLVFTGPLSPREIVPKAEAAARKAIALDDRLPKPHRTLGQILTYFYWNWQDAETEFRRARELRPRQDAIDVPWIERLIREGRLDEAVRSAEDARRRDPLSFDAQMIVAVAHRARGESDRAVAEFRRALDITPRRPRAHFELGVTFVEMKRYDEAIREMEDAVRASNGATPRFAAYLGYTYALAGRPLDARRILADLLTRARTQYVTAFGIALIHDALGEKELALAAFERAYEERAVEFAQMSPYLPAAGRVIASSPRYEAVIRRIGLAPAPDVHATGR
jgi:DNA-binding winged helix-turn-helix (wHTH) protein/tetratricopeptide (TPR) repeat protein